MNIDYLNNRKNELKLTNAKLAELSGVPMSTLSKIMAGIVSNPKINTLKAISDVLECTIDDICEFDDSNSGARIDLGARRKELGLTLEEVGNFVGVTKSTVKKWETGYIDNMKRDKIALLSKVLQISPLAIIGISENLDPCNADNVFDISDLEKQLVLKYRDNPQMQEAVCKLLGVDVGNQIDD